MKGNSTVFEWDDGTAWDFDNWKPGHNFVLVTRPISICPLACPDLIQTNPKGNLIGIYEEKLLVQELRKVTTDNFHIKALKWVKTFTFIQLGDCYHDIN